MMKEKQMASQLENEDDSRRLESEIEALLFASDEPLSAGKLSALTETNSVKKVKSVISDLEEFTGSMTEVTGSSR